MNLVFNLSLCSGGPKRNLYAQKEKWIYQTRRGQWCYSKTYYYKEPHGLQCQNPAHLGSSQSLNVEHDFCEKCVKTSGNILNQRYWTLPKLIYIRSTCPIFFVVLVSRSSTHMTISNSMYEALNETILEKNR